ncbi:retrovirus-related Pol polyprotein from transposon 297 [Nephila pilipes]|uniref:Retrovirus-related Pol polyprotein from transposon 297 n=1 Tax=Nephila pilipes TaxID=299642 RepID=A0A8X6UFA9_NEPPI|nr:retrovirus-related Pol polyprotein from transposon 297 [Nephila pilipes]
MDTIPASPSSTELPVYLPDKADAMEHVVWQGFVKAFITYQELPNNRIFVSFSSPSWFQKKTFMDNFKADKRMGFIYNNMFIVKCFFIFGLRKVEPGMIHLIQTTKLPVLIYELPPSSRRSQAEPNLYQRSFEPYNQMLYHRTVIEPHTSYPFPVGMHCILMTIQKTVFALDVVPETVLTTLLQNGFRLGGL